MRSGLAGFAARRASQARAPRRAVRWLRLACALTPAYTESFGKLVALLRTADQRLDALAVARSAAVRFPEHPDAWMLLGDAYQLTFKPKEALHAYEQVLVFEERADAALSAGRLQLRAGHPAEAAARFARAYAAGAGPDALRENAQALSAAGDHDAAEAALTLWATQVPDGMEKLTAVRAELQAGRAKP